MAVRSVNLLGDPVLRTPSDAVVNPRSPAVRMVADDLQETFRFLKSKHGVGRGLAAPQIGAPIRMIYVEIDEPWFILNPKITDIGDEDFWVWDDCFSVPNLLVRVQRAFRVEVVYQDLSGDRRRVESEGALAELLQHEIDHLDGVLCLDRPTGHNAMSLKQEWQKHHEAGGRYGPPEPRLPERDYFAAFRPHLTEPTGKAAMNMRRRLGRRIRTHDR